MRRTNIYSWRVGAMIFLILGVASKTLAALPTLVEAGAIPITENSAYVSSYVTSDGGRPIIERGFVYSATNINSNPLVGGPGVIKITASGTTGGFNATLSGLTALTQYTFRPYATNLDGTGYSGQGTFTTLASTNADLSSLTLSSGTLSPAFASATTAYTVSVANTVAEITVTPVRAQDNATIEAQVNGGTYAAVASGGASGALALNVGSNTVDVRVTAQDGITQKTYTVAVTRMAAPTVTTPTASSITATGATLGGNVTFDGGTTVLERGVVLAVSTTTNDPVIGGANVTKVTATGTTGLYITGVAGLQPGTSYHYKAYATNSVGTAYTSAVTFSTLNLAGIKVSAGIDPSSPPFSLPSASSDGTPLSYTLVAGAGMVSLAGNTVTLTGQNGPATIRVTGAGLDDQYLSFRVEPSPRFKKVFAQNTTTYGLKEDGTIWSWGNNGSRHLGVANLTFRRRPSQMNSDTDWADLAAPENGSQFAAIKSDGRLFTWGANGSGQLGIGSTTTSKTPVLVSGEYDWKQVAVGSTHMIGLKLDGSLWAWGSNANGRLGDGTTVNQSVPIRIGADTDWKFVAAGHAASYAIKNDGTLWAWGFNGNGRLGDGTTTERRTPIQIGTANDWAVVDGGITHTMALKTDSSLWIWGANASGQIGNGTTTDQLSPVQLMAGTSWQKFYAGRDNSMAIRSDGTLWAWGSNVRGQLGNGTMNNQSSPVQVGSDNDWREISCAEHSAGVKLDGRIWTAGTDDQGELGNSSWWHYPIGGAANRVSSFTTGQNVTVFIRNDGTLWALGTNSNLCLGLGLLSAAEQVWEPTQVGVDNDWSKVSAGQYHVMAIKKNGTLWAWGRNTEGQLGLGNNLDQAAPVQIGADSDWACVQAGYNHSAAIKKDGTLWAWGTNVNGQLGDGTTTSKTSPVKIGVDDDWIFISSGDHNLALKIDRSLWGWGKNASGQVGNGGTNDVLVPVRVGTDTDWQKIEAGLDHSLALKSNQRLWAWGSNVWGQTNIATTSTPSPVGTSNDWSDLLAGGQFSLAVKNDGSCWSSGNGYYGRLGHGFGAERNAYNLWALTKVGQSNAFMSVADGGASSETNMILTKTGELWAAGLTSGANKGAHKRHLTPQIVFSDLEQQVVTVEPLAPATVGVPMPLIMNASSGLPVSYSVSGPALFNGNSLTVTQPGVVTITAWQSGDEVWDITPPMSQTFLVEPLASLSLSQGVLSPAFAGDVTNYSTTVPNEVGTMTVTPRTVDSGLTAQVRVNAGDFAPVLSGLPSMPLPLIVGENTVDVLVSVQGGDTQMMYSIQVTRLPSSNADLSSLTLSSGALSPAFASATTAYTASVANTVTLITVTPTRAEANASIEARVNGGTYTAVTSGSPSAALPLNVDGNTVEVRVTAQDGVTQKIYTVAINRLRSYLWAGFAGTAEVVGSTDATGATAAFAYPGGVALDSAGNAYVADTSNHTIRKITPAGVVTTLAGMAGTPGTSDGSGAAARFNTPGGVAVDSSGNVYVADTSNHTIRRITSTGLVTTFAGSGGTSGSADGPGNGARFLYPNAVAVDSSGNVYVADTNNHTIRKITSTRVVSTLAGTAGSSGSTDATGAAARFNYPMGVAVGAAGTVVVADQFNHTLRSVTSTGVVTTLAGVAGEAGNANGPALQARFNYPAGVAVDAAGRVYVADSLNHTIRRMEPDGTVLTIGGQAETAGSTEGADGVARFSGPMALAVDALGRLYVADQNNSRISSGTPAAYLPSAALTSLSGLGLNTVTLSGSVTPNGLATTAVFDYGPTIAYGSTIAATPSSLQGTAAQEVSVSLSSLLAGSIYYYRLRVTNVDGTQNSTGGSFTTLTLTQGWRQTHFGSISNSGSAADAADPDHDGLPNLLEYALNLSPNAASQVPASVQRAGANLEYTYTRGTAAYNGGTVFQVEWSDDLTTWVSTGVLESLLSDDGTHQEVQATLPAGSGDGRFVRLRVE